MKSPSFTPTRSYSIGSCSYPVENLKSGLYIVATPIGNLADITLRALTVLAGAQTILCEDTRVSGKLLYRYGIKTKLLAYHDHNAKRLEPGLISSLKAGGALALISDAGMPLISDPGFGILRAALAENIAVTVCPGASAALTGLALADLPTEHFGFFGFLPATAQARHQLLYKTLELDLTLIFFESPHRILATLTEIDLLAPERSVALARELTKLHEEILRGTAKEVRKILAERPSIKGEMTLVIGPPAEAAPVSISMIAGEISDMLKTMSPAQTARLLGRKFKLKKEEIYHAILAAKKNDTESTM